MLREVDSQLRSHVEESERALVLGHYETAELLSNNVLTELQQTVGSEDASSLKERAAIVFVQSVFETSTFSKARTLLCSSFESLDKVPANAILLWISLALETDERRQADSLILVLLRSKASRQSGWTREQYLTLVHMYATDILLPTLKDPSEVHLWLRRQTFVPLDPRERQFLEQQVSEKALLLQQHHQSAGMYDGDSTPPHQGSFIQRAGTDGPVITPMRSMVSTQRNSREEGRVPRDCLPGYTSSPEKQSSFSQRTSHSFDIESRKKHEYGLGIDLNPVELEIGSLVTGPESKNTQQDVPPLESLDFLGRIQHLFFRALGMHGIQSEPEEEMPHHHLLFSSSGGLTMTTVGVAFLAYLVYSSRGHPARLGTGKRKKASQSFMAVMS